MTWDATKTNLGLSVSKVDSVEDFDNIVGNCNNILSTLKPLECDYGNVYNELKVLNVSVSPNPTLQEITSDIQKVQSAKDRVSEILLEVHRNFLVRKRICELLREGWVSFSSHNSAEKRRGEAFLKLSNFINSATEAESLYKSTSHIMKNLDSKQENLSRQVTIMSLALKLNDFGSSGDFTKSMATAKSLYCAKDNDDDFADETELGDKQHKSDDDRDMYNW